MSLKQLHAIPPVMLVTGLALLLCACDFVIASNPSPGSTVPQTGATSAPPPVALAGTPEVQPTVDAVVQQRIAEILTPSPRAEERPTPQPDDPPAPRPTPILVHFPTPTPSGGFQAEYYRSGFACTGSMRPTIDCGDEGVFLKPPFQEPLIVGDVISFSLEPSCRHYTNHNISKAHRIVSIRAEDGAQYYTTKGDSAQTPDSCEVTIERIDGKLVEIKKGVRPQDIIDTSEYDFARERVGQLKEQYEVKKADYDQRKAEYEAHGEEYEQLVASYRAGRAGYDEVNESHRKLEEERIALNQLMGDLNSLGEEINATIDEVDRIYQELFIRGRG